MDYPLSKIPIDHVQFMINPDNKLAVATVNMQLQLNPRGKIDSTWLTLCYALLESKREAVYQTLLRGLIAFAVQQMDRDRHFVIRLYRLSISDKQN